MLSLFGPGLGLLRLRRWQAAIAIFGASVLFLSFMTIAPLMPFSFLAVLLLAGLSLYVVAFWLTWRFSRILPQNRPWYARWYSVVGALGVVIAVSLFFTDPGRVRYRSFYTPSEGMTPTLPKGDRFFAYMRAPTELRRGQLVLVRAQGEHIYVKRIAGLPGDRIGLKNGVVLLNGSPVTQRHIKTDRIQVVFGQSTARRLSERFPGEPAPHEIYDSGISPGDEMGEQLVRPGYVFVLGDNRDRSADSRFPPEMQGLDQVAVDDILGQPLYQSWGSSRPLGTPLSR